MELVMTREGISDPAIQQKDDGRIKAASSTSLPESSGNTSSDDPPRDDPRETEGKKLPCPKCNRELGSLWTLKDHLVRRHKDIEETYGCENYPQCPQFFDSSNARRRHMPTCDASN